MLVELVDNEVEVDEVEVVVRVEDVDWLVLVLEVE